MSKLKRRATLEPGGGIVKIGEKGKVASRKVEVPTLVKFGFGTVSAVGATFFTHPIDVVKYALQLNRSQGGTLVSAGKKIVADNGVQGLYKGLSASMMRQVSYGTVRLGIYQTLMEKFTKTDGSPPPLWQKLSFSAAAGGIGAFCGNPFDLALVRMAADGTLPPAERRNYNGVFDAISRVIRQEGFTSLWVGAGPTITRCISLNMAQLTTYSQAKEELLKLSAFDDNIITHLSASMISGLVATAVSTPFDVAKTRIQQDSLGEFKGMGDCLLQTCRKEGVLSMWKGFVPAYFRLAPQTVLVFVFLEQLTQGYTSYYSRH